MRRLCKGILGALLIGVASADAGPAVLIAINPRVLYAGGSAWVICTVPRDAANRGLTARMEYRSMFDQLNGEQSAITHRFLFEHVPCTAGAAECVLEAQGRKPISASMTVVLAGCEGE